MSVLTPQHYPVAASGVFTTSVAPRVEIGGQLLGPSLLTRAQSGPQLGVTTAVPADHDESITATATATAAATAKNIIPSSKNQYYLWYHDSCVSQYDDPGPIQCTLSTIYGDANNGITVICWFTYYRDETNERCTYANETNERILVTIVLRSTAAATTAATITAAT
mmetsp:Transcript_55760/g.60332  ORF Transcript_55760/g.60332 Transcript_55760/m.60332 type:complete len:166 (+) Transcript_55760:766-1263(+)